MHRAVEERRIKFTHSNGQHGDLMFRLSWLEEYEARMDGAAVEPE